MASTQVQILGLRNLLAGLGALPTAIKTANLGAMQTAVLLVESDAKSRVPRKSGRLFSSIQSDVDDTASETTGEITGSVGTDVQYAPFVEQGTSAHEIAPLTAMALMVPVAKTGGFGGATLSGRPRAGQQVAFFARVRHPGTTAKPYLEPALTDNESKIQDIFTAAAQKVLGLVRGI